MSFPQYYLQLEDAEGNYVQLLIECAEYPLSALVQAIAEIPGTYVLSEKAYTMQKANGRNVADKVGNAAPQKG